jgi:hypothetical protein
MEFAHPLWGITTRKRQVDDSYRISFSVMVGSNPDWKMAKHALRNSTNCLSNYPRGASAEGFCCPIAIERAHLRF